MVLYLPSGNIFSTDTFMAEILSFMGLWQYVSFSDTLVLRKEVKKLVLYTCNQL
jgi:hypothetical protein